jgi:fatty-acyl-CoA synthase
VCLPQFDGDAAAALIRRLAAARQGADPVPVAFVCPSAGAALEEENLRAVCRQQLARFKVPARIVVVDSFPTVESPNGLKVQKVRLREMAEALLREQRPELINIRAPSS